MPTMIQGFQMYGALVGILVVIMFVYPWMTLPILIIVVIFYQINKLYIRTMQALKNTKASSKTFYFLTNIIIWVQCRLWFLNKTAKSPVFTRAKASLDGLVTIRSSGEDSERILIIEFDRLQNVHSGAYFFIIGTLYTLIMTFAAFFTLSGLTKLSKHLDDIFQNFSSRDLTGRKYWFGIVAVSNSLKPAAVWFETFWGTHGSNDQRFSSFWVHSFYLENLPLAVKESLPEDWPYQRKIRFKNLSIRYKLDSPIILQIFQRKNRLSSFYKRYFPNYQQNLNLTIEGGWKMGIVVRNGSRKSLIMSALFRLYTSNLEGEISIDGQDTSVLGLWNLRSKISIIPRCPFSNNSLQFGSLFSKWRFGSWRCSRGRQIGPFIAKSGGH